MRSAAALVLLLSAPVLAQPPTVERDSRRVEVKTEQLRLSADLRTGLWDIRWPGGAAVSGAACAARLVGRRGDLDAGPELSSGTLTEHRCTPVSPISDAFGTGVEVVVAHRSAAPDGPELRQHWRVYPSLPYLFVSLEMVSPTPLSSNYLAPLLGRLELDAGDRPQSLYVPYDNDSFVPYSSRDAANSYEVTAVYDNASRRGFVLGSVTHDLWKTGFSMLDIGKRAVGHLSAYGGAIGKSTHDVEPHGSVTGKSIESPRLLVGYFGDWRSGLETFGQANARIKPPLPWSGGVPFGWNSWAAYAKKVDFAHVTAVADFLREHLAPSFQNHGATVVDLDSFWTNLSPAQLRELPRRLHAAGQKAGIYWTPFAWWGSNMKSPVEGTGGRYTYGDLLLKDSHGKLVRGNQVGKALDPTHPGTLARIDYNLSQFVDWGYDFVKLDFVNYGDLEGVHADPRITTGVAAYNLGMQRVIDDLDARKIGREFFINLSIAPLFPSGYGHSRRIACDTFGSMASCEYSLNALTYSWWTNGTLYRFNDPDETVLKNSELEGRARVNASAITGTVMLNGDDLTDPVLQARAERLLTNPEINAVARAGVAFRPVEGDAGERAATAFVRIDADGSGYLALFNFGDKDAHRTLDLARLGFDKTTAYLVRDLWSGREQGVSQMLDLTLAPRESTILRFGRQAR